jgi:putative spermidine/putrescine transport system permease protein
VKRGRRPADLALGLFVGAVFVFLSAPSLVIAVAAFNAGTTLTFPPQGLSLRWFQAFFASAEFTDALRTSVTLAVLATLSALAVGGMAAFALDRYRVPRRAELEAFFLSPLVVPMIVIGIAILQFFALLQIPRSFLLLFLGHLVITIPYTIRTLLASLSGLDRNLEEAARNLGATAFVTFRRVTLPLVAPGLMAAGIFAFIESFGNLTLSVFIAGPRVATLPVRLFAFIEFSFDPTVAAVSTVILAVVVLAMLLLTRVASLERLFG